MNKSLLHIFTLLTSLLTLGSCIDDSFSTSSADQPQFSVDTLKIGIVFTDEMTATHRFTVHNPSSKSISIDDIALSGDGAKYFRLNVDGFSGTRFNNVEIRGKDSIYVFVDATLPENNSNLPVEIRANVDFNTKGQKRSVTISAYGQDVTRLHAYTVNDSETFEGGKPYQIFDSLVVAKGATLTLNPGTRLLFHDKASLIVYGTLICDGTVNAPVTLAGDRSGNVVTDISFDLMSRQWQGVYFRPGSVGNIISHTTVKNMVDGVIVDGEGADAENVSRVNTLRIHNSRIRNSGGTALAVFHANVVATGSEFAEAGGGLVWLQGGEHRFNHCTFANYYLFSAIGGSAVGFGHLNAEDDDGSGLPYTEADITNSIIYGLGADVMPGDLTGTAVTIRRCLLKSNGTDDDNFVACLWNTDPMYYTVRSDYYFDYRLKDESPAIAAANPELMLPESEIDAYGLHRGSTPDLGAYVYQPSGE